MLAAGLLCAGASLAFAQFYRGGMGGGIWVEEGTQTAREIGTRSTGTPEWVNPVGFEKDVFTFARLRYGVQGWRGGVGGGTWSTDLPDADLNLSYRLQQMTSMKVDPNARILRADDPALKSYPFIMTAAPGAMELTESEQRGLRDYLLNGGFFLLTDFWGQTQWDWFEREMQQVLPGLRWVELSLDHPIYRMVFDIRAKNQVPRIGIGTRALRTGSDTHEQGPTGREVHHRAWFDEKGRMMVLALHNSDDSDGWEREGEDHEYFLNFAEKMAYPLAINILLYQMTH